SLALRGDGTVVAWGVDDAGQTDVPAGLSSVSALTGNMEYCLALKKDGTVVSWGNAPTVPANLSGVTALAAGEDHCLALKSDGTVVVWGRDDSGQLDLPANLGKVSSLGAGWNYSVALVSGSVSSPPPPFNLTNVSWSGGTFSVSVASQSSHNYVLQYKELLNDANWTSLAPVAGTGQPLRLSDSNANSGHRVYRVQEF